MNTKIKFISKGILLFLAMIFSFLLILVVSYMFSNENIRKNAASAIEIFDKEGDHYSPFYPIESKLNYANITDNFTDAIILTVVINKNEENNILNKSLSNYYFMENTNPRESFKSVLNDENKPSKPYVRYWFGSVAFTRVLLKIFTYEEIRYINFIIIFMLFLISTHLIYKKLDIRYALIFAFSIVFMGIIAIPMSIQYTPVFIITLISSIIILKLYENEKFDKYIYYLFILIGGITAYFDLLTFPLITLGIPLIIAFLLKNQNNEQSLKNNIFFILKICIIWSLSYFGTYFAKWVIASIFLGNNEVKFAFEHFLKRANMEDENKFNRLETISKNFELYFNKFTIIYIIGVLIYYLKNIIKKNINKKFEYQKIIPLIIIAIFPYIWYSFLTNHSFMHSWMTYRIQSITLFSITAILIGTLKKYEKE